MSVRLPPVAMRGTSAGLLAYALCLFGCGRPDSTTSGPSVPAGRRTPSGPPPPVRLVDRAGELGVRFQYEHGGTGKYYYLEMAGGGVALLDYDGDGWLDIYFPQGAPLPGSASAPRANALFRNRGNGQGFEEVARRAGVTGDRNGKHVYCIGCAVGDYDNDGFPDLFVTGYQGAFLYRNRGNGTFEDVTRKSGVADTRFGSSAAFLDYDADGNLDLLVCEYLVYDLGKDVHCQNPAGEKDYCRPDFYRSGRSRLYHNEGAGRFRDVTDVAGLTSASNKALGVIAGDVDGDGDQDIYLACDMTPNLLYVNLGGGKFREEAVTRNCALSSLGNVYSGMGVDMQDVDGDGNPELWVTNYWDEANNLYRNLGGGMFQDVATSVGLPPSNTAQVSFGTGLRDLNHDGWPDLFVTNGHVLEHPEGSTPGASRKQTDQLFLNQGAGSFRDGAPEGGPWFRTPHVGRGAAFGDLDNDGDLDVVISNNVGPNAVLMNEGTRYGHWVQFILRGKQANRSGIGARLELTAGGRTQVAEVRSAHSYCSASDVRAHFGVGSARMVERVVVRWPGGRVDTVVGVPVDQLVTLTEGGDSVR